MYGERYSDVEKDLIERAAQVMPGGGFGNFAADIVLARGKGGRVWDESGNEYVDFLLGSGPMLVGHNHPDVLAAVERQLPNGVTFFANNAQGIQLAEAICDAVACADKLRFVSTGSEADMYAMRLARAHRGRDKILKFEGGYHGMSESSLMSLAPKRLVNFPMAVPDSAGIPAAVSDNILVAPFNDAEVARQLISEYADELAGVIVEPFQRLMPPEPGFLECLREETERHGIVLIFDEVVTGFRFAYGGAQEVYGVTPDLCTLGKVIGGGFPLAAIAGKDEIMAHFDKDRVGEAGFTFQVGTLSGNPVASAAGLATLEILRRPGSYDRIQATGRTIMQALEQNFARVGIPVQVIGHPSLFDIVFTDRPVRNYRDFLVGDTVRMKRFNTLLRQRGILKPDSKFYMSLAHDEADIAQTVDAIRFAADTMKSEL
ncbi:MAG TPA: aminotransferase class III-fold pyridoxal phosphate-dependent enzyme [Thermohalobaculum sp.]|nr:aminotransferase class III-fold pyridoxal phosphate-dependent enzyme [Thermohalobaculum sp.]